MEYIVKILIILYLIVINLAGFCMMGADKRKARNGKWRVKESVLFLTAVIGGSLGSWLGMYAFRHKTKHWYFVVGMPLILILQVAAILFLLYRVGNLPFRV